MGQHPVDAIRLFADILDKKDRTGEIWQIGRAHQRRQHGQVAAEQSPPRHAGAEGADAPGPLRQTILMAHRVGKGRRPRVKGDRAEGVPAILAPTARRIGAVYGGKARLRRESQMKRGDVGKADQQLGIFADGREVEPGQDAGAAPAAAHCKHRAHLRIGEHRVHVRRPLRIGARQIAIPPRQMRRGLWLQAHGENRFLDQVKVEGIIGEARRFDQPDRVARAQAWRLHQRGRGRRHGGCPRQQRADASHGARNGTCHHIPSIDPHRQ